MAKRTMKWGLQETVTRQSLTVLGRMENVEVITFTSPNRNYIQDLSDDLGGKVVRVAVYK